MHTKKMDIKEIERYWGSLEAYNEEQRRVGLVALEMQQVENLGAINFRSNSSVESEDTITSQPSQRHHGFHLFGHRA